MGVFSGVGPAIRAVSIKPVEALRDESICLKIFDRDRLVEILQVFVANPFRTFLSGLGVGWGLFMIIVTVGASNGLKKMAFQLIWWKGEELNVFWTQWTSMPYKGFNKGRNFNFNRQTPST